MIKELKKFRLDDPEVPDIVKGLSSIAPPVKVSAPKTAPARNFGSIDFITLRACTTALKASIGWRKNPKLLLFICKLPSITSASTRSSSSFLSLFAFGLILCLINGIPPNTPLLPPTISTRYSFNHWFR